MKPHPSQVADLTLLTCAIRRARWFAAASTLCLLTPVAVAQSASDDRDAAYKLDDTVVEASTGATVQSADSYKVERSSTATRLSLTPRETPQSVSVVTAAQLRDFQLTGAIDALETTPGVSVERVETDRTYFTARGFDITNFQFDGLGTPMMYKNIQGDIDTAVYERVEVLRGANGLLSGTGNPSATVNFVRKRPTREAQTSLSGTVGSWNHKRLEADVSGPLGAADKVRGRLVVSAQDGESYLDRMERERHTVYGVVEIDMTDRTLLTAGHSWQQNNTDSPLWGALPLYYTDGSPTDYDASTSTSADWAYWDNTDNRSFVELSHLLASGWEVKGALNYLDHDSNSELFYQYGTPDRQTGLGLFAYPSQYELNIEKLVADLHVKGPFAFAGRDHELVAGVQWSRSELEDMSNYGQGIGTPLPPLDQWNGNYPKPPYNSGVDGSEWIDKQAGLYSTARLSLTDRLTGLVGGRLSRFEGDGNSYGVTRDTSYSGVFTPFAGLVFDLNERMSLYASYTEIFQPQTEVDANRDRLDPIEGVQYETGIKAEMPGGADASLALFRIEQDNVAEARGTIPGSVDTAYVGRQGLTSEGVEATLAGEVLPNLQASLGYTYIDLQDSEGERARAFIPQHMVRAMSTYRLPFYEAVKVGAQASWQDVIYREQGAGITSRQDAYALVDLMASYDLSENLTATLNVNNVTDEKYLTSLYFAQSYYGAPRHAMLTLAWDY
ncbi:TonB-dependent siderophore receptor [Halopseudomonas laoshanensis]|uniref:TonB-dependent siderophore receptor n=1 Tax=Halopseudomonas laoshanensis TaxID=2268758 RepID=UPI0015B6B0F2|nr:TonB-dependent siderophore receptor [Halopseudomonas laoshanensis]